MNHSKSGLFLMELIICILFFALSAALCVQMFAHSHTVSKKNIDENNAILLCNNLAECFYAEFGELSKISDKFYPNNSKVENNAFTAYYNESFEPVVVSDSMDNFEGYILELSEPPASDTGIRKGDISFFKTDSSGIANIFNINLQVNQPNHI